VQGYELGPEIEGDEHYALLRHVVELKPHGVALEFGVGSGQSTRIIAEGMPVIGFDSFEGLPEDWRPGFPKGMFAEPGPPDIPGAVFVPGLFENTLPDFLANMVSRPVGLVHIDCDLYSSTRTVLFRAGYLMLTGTYVVFDEWHGYEGAERYEQRAWREFAAATGITWTVVGHTFQQWGIRIE
jgi:hypothetical protein